MKITVLGCGTSSGVPLIGCGCEVCSSTDPRNRRLRCSVLVESEGDRVIVDSGPDFRQQCLRAGIDRLDGILFTHGHADHLHGIDDVRAFNFLMRRPIEAFAHAEVFADIRKRFDYAFQEARPEHGWWRPVLTPNVVDGPFRIGGIDVVPIEQRHGRNRSWGFRFGRFAYCPDVSGFSDEELGKLAGIDVWIVDALRDRPHPSHAHLDMTLGWIERIRPRLAVLTHMNHQVDYADWAARLPVGVVPAYDGMELLIDGA